MESHGIPIARQSPAAALASLGSGPQGLTTAEARRRLGEFGPNQVMAAPRDPLWLMLAREFTHFFALILWLAAGLAFFADHFGPGQGMAELGWAIVGVILVNGAFSFWQSYRAEQALAALKQLLPQQVEVRRDGKRYHQRYRHGDVDGNHVVGLVHDHARAANARHGQRHAAVPALCSRGRAPWPAPLRPPMMKTRSSASTSSPDSQMPVSCSLR